MANIFNQYSDENGISYLEKLNEDQIKLIYDYVDVKQMKLHTHSVGTFLDWHPADEPFLIVVLSGVLELTVSDGTSVKCEPGYARFTSDLGKGHKAQVIGDQPCTVLMIRIGKKIF